MEVEETESVLDEIPGSEEATLIAEESLVSDKESNSSELTGRMVSRRGRPRDLGLARMYLKGCWWTKPIGLTMGQK